MRTRWLFIVFSIPCLAGPDARVDWPGFRGPNGSGVAGAGGLPSEIGPEKNLIWKTPAPPAANIPSPVLYKNVLSMLKEGSRDRSNSIMLRL